MRRIELVDQLIEKTKRKMALLEELREAILEEAATHVAVLYDTRKWVLIERATGAKVKHGTREEVQKYIDRRKLKAHWRVPTAD